MARERPWPGRDPGDRCHGTLDQCGGATAMAGSCTVAWRSLQDLVMAFHDGQAQRHRPQAWLPTSLPASPLTRRTVCTNCCLGTGNGSTKHRQQLQPPELDAIEAIRR